MKTYTVYCSNNPCGAIERHYCSSFSDVWSPTKPNIGTDVNVAHRFFGQMHGKQFGSISPCECRFEVIELK